VYYQQLAILGGINCLLALAIYLPFSTGLLVMCFGTFMGAGAIVAAASHSTWGLPFPLALLLGASAGAIAAALIGGLCVRLGGFAFAMATLGMGELIRTSVNNVEGLGGALGYRDIQIGMSPIYLVAAVASWVIVFSLFERSVMRQAFRLIREDQALASSIGIDVGRHRLLAMTAGGFVAGLAGGFYVHSVGILEPRVFGFDASVLILMYAVVGGYSFFVGPLLGALVLTVIPEILRFSAALRMVLYGASLLVFIVLFPEGISGVRVHRRRYATRKPSDSRS
jgi:branched-chain amino acid transport system permease protein